LEVPPEDGVPHVPNYALRRFRVDDTREVGIKYTPIFVVPTVHLQEMCAEILHNRFIIICPITERGDIFLNLKPIVDLGLEKIGFIKEQHKMDALQQGIGTDLGKEL